MASAVLGSPEIPLRASADDESLTSQCSVESSFRELDDAFLQTQTRIWLGEVLHARFDQETAVSDLLADGEVLFAVSERIWGMLLDPTLDLSLINVVERKSVASGNSAARYMKYSKVDTFLQICKSVGLAGIDLFTPSDVVEKKNTRKVCMCIRSLSKKARAKKLDVPDFDIVTCTVAMPTNMVGFMRRSWELGQYSSSASSSHDVEKNSRTRSGQRKSGAASAGSNDSCSDDAGSDVAESHGRILKYSSDATSQLNTESPAMRKYSPTHVPLELMLEDVERDETPGENMSPYLCESVGSPFSQRGSSDCHLVDSMTPPSPFLGSRVSGKVYRKKMTDTHSYEDGMLNPVHLDWEDGSCAHEDDSGDSIEEDDDGISNGGKGDVDLSDSGDSIEEDGISNGGKGDVDLSYIEADCSDIHALAGAGDTFSSEIDVGLLRNDSPASIVRQGRSLHDDEEGMDSVNSTSAAGMDRDLQRNFSGGTFDHITDNNLLMHHSNSDCGKALPDIRIEDNGLSEDCSSPNADKLSNSNECRDYYLYDDGICISQIYTEVFSGDSSHHCGFPKDDSNSRVKQIQGFEAVRYPCNINSDDTSCSCTAASVESNATTDVHKSTQFFHDGGGGGYDSPKQTDKDALDSSVVESFQVCNDAEAADETRLKQHKKRQGKKLLKSVMSGTAIAGVMFLLFQLRYTVLINILVSYRKTCSQLITKLSPFIKELHLFDCLWYVNGGMGGRKRMKLLLQRLIRRGNNEGVAAAVVQK